MIAAFPILSPIDDKVRSDVTRLCGPWRSYQQFSYAVMFSYDSGTDGVADLGGNLVLSTAHPASGHRAYALCGRRNIAKAARQILETAPQDGAHLHLVPQDVACELAAHGFRIERDDTASEYMLELDQTLQATMKYRRVWSAREFEKRFGPTFDTLELHDAGVAAEIEALAERWGRDRFGMRVAPEADQPSSALADLRALHRLLERRQDFALEAYGVRVGGALVAFNLLETATETLVSLLFSKSDRQYRRVGDYLLVSSLRHLLTTGRRHLNVAEDLGIPTLRQYKRSLHPTATADKFTVRL